MYFNTFDPKNIQCDIKPEKYYFVIFTMIRVLKRFGQVEGYATLSATETNRKRLFQS